MEDKELLTELYRDMYNGMISKDRTVLERVLAPDFTLIHMTGMQQNREEYITGIENGTLNYYSEETVNIEISIVGQFARVIGQSIVSAAVFGGGKHTWRLEQDINLAKKNGQWRITKSVAGTF
ncbi:MAG: nuclear transport factor 2 family protein [Clostridia bacterium]|nr:nuclear transport factor 2 family protein [Clostridia bacterium]MBQ3464179.1 nuclear transport factor 2 family protein [Clostridia bacterium]